MIDFFKKLVQAGVHFGHRTSIWNPRMAPYIWGHKNNVYLIDVSKTAYQLEKAKKFLENVAAEGNPILWVGTKKAAQQSIKEVAEQLGMPYVNHRWIGGSLSNYSQVRKSITKLMHYEDVLAKDSSAAFYTKKELNSFGKMIERLRKNIGGIVNLKWPLGAIVLIDINKEGSALREAAMMHIPVVALVDTNCDPTLVNYVIPGNDDAPRSIKLILGYLQEGVQRGMEVAQQKGDQAQVVVGEEEVEEIVIAEVKEDEEVERSKKQHDQRCTESEAKPRGKGLVSYASVRETAPSKPKVTANAKAKMKESAKKKEMQTAKKKASR